MLRKFFSPSSIAVIGATPGTGRIGGKVLSTLLAQRYEGNIYPVNPSHQEIAGLKTYPSVEAIGQQVDVALIAIPATRVPAVVRDCASLGIPYVVIFSSGFAEEGEAGRRLQAELEDIRKETGIRISGPNAEGYFNSIASIAATFSPALNIESGKGRAGKRIGVVSQSGGLGFALYNRGRREDLLFSHIVSVGNQVDLEAADYLEEMVDDSATDVILMYAESFKDARRFIGIAQRAAERGKPIVMAKVGRSKAGQRAAASHTGAIAGPTQVCDAALASAGIIQAQDQDQLLDIAAGLSHYAPITGNRVAIISTSGGTAVWLSDACEAMEFELPEVDSERQKQIAEFIPAYGSTANPVDITAQGVNAYAKSLEVLADADYLDAFIIVSSFAHEARLSSEGAELAELVRRVGKPVLFYSYTVPSEASRALLREYGIHCFTTMLGCVRALAGLRTYGLLQQRLAARPARQSPPDLSLAAVELLGARQSTLCEYESKSLLRNFGIQCPDELLADDVDSGLAAAHRLGYPVALKVQSPDLPHKSEAGAIALNIRDGDALRVNFDRLLTNARTYAPEAEIRGVLVQHMAPAGVEMIAGIVNDAEFGPFVMVGLGGIYVEVLQDTVLAPAPLDKQEARRMLRSLKGWPLLAGVRGEPPRDVEAMADLLVQLSDLAVAAEGHLAELDVNPIFVHEQGKGLTIVDALAIRK
ncbi:acetate--CoA ligase family protein [Cupriavidus sp. BIS7]|uniref:acetate--CoA ligase family protein n=1 Tax=Cupriavidus sp. BIS7 TaxID=1217718 RepID=UPI0003773225|nr:acetate--CoA ligase family protein [Cupriavidus sp. BIS7]